jgi:hypothetical protein
MTVAFILWQYLLDSLEPVAKNDFLFGAINLIQRCIDVIEKFLWLAKHLVSQSGLQMAEARKVRGCQIRAIREIKAMDDVTL